VIKIQKNEKGFSAVEAILIIVVIVLVGVVGWYVYKQHKNVPKVAPTTSVTTMTTANTNQNEFKIPALGVEFSLPASLSDLTYTVSGGTATISTQSLSQEAPDCSASVNYGGFYDVSVGSGTWPGNQPDVTLVKQFPKNYVTLSHNQMSCTSGSSTTRTSTSINNDVSNDQQAFQSAIRSVALIPTSSPVSVSATTNFVSTFYTEYTKCFTTGNLNQTCTKNLVGQDGTKNLYAYYIPPTGYSYPADPITCAQDTPNSISVSKGTVYSGAASGTVAEAYDSGPSSIQFSVVGQSGNLKIDSITCNPALPASLGSP
jgi:hypothetical protein